MSIYKEALKFYIPAKTIYRIHSPFFYSLISNVLTSKHYYAFDEIEFQRKQLESSDVEIKMIELGAGSRKFHGNTRKVSDIAKSSLSSKWQCQVMFRLVEYLSPSTILEIGSSLGISTAYLAKANSKAHLFSLEGNPDSLNIARNVARNVKVQNLSLVPGNFDDSLGETLKEIEKLDFAFIDGNHRREPTLNYFNLMKSKLHDQSVVVFDDIYWSQEMKEAWLEIKNMDEVKASLDFFYFGVVFFDPIFKDKKHLKVIETKYKAWQKFI